MEGKARVQEFKLAPEWELRFEVESKNEKVTLKLTSGSAEVFGTELVIGNKYEFTCGAKIAVYTWHGCTLELIGKTSSSYVGKETPMTTYLNCHDALEGMRELAERENTRGPVVIVVGPSNVGKSTLCRLLLNYAARIGRCPIYIDLDVSQGNIAIPGTMGALHVKTPCDAADGFSQQAPLVAHFGHEQPSANSELYKHLITKMAKICLGKLEDSKKATFSGIVINTSECMQEGYYGTLTHAAQAFEVDTILVLDQERLYHQLLKDIPPFVNLMIIPKSGGVVVRTEKQKTEARNRSIREYFYGSKTPLHPYSFEVKWSDVKIFKIGGPQLPSSCLPYGMTPVDNSKRIVPVPPIKKVLGQPSDKHLINHILSVSFAKSPKADVAQSNVAGCVCITSVNVDRETFTILSPKPGPLPHNILLLSEIQFAEDTS